MVPCRDIEAHVGKNASSENSGIDGDYFDCLIVVEWWILLPRALWAGGKADHQGWAMAMGALDHDGIKGTCISVSATHVPGGLCQFAMEQGRSLGSGGTQ